MTEEQNPEETLSALEGDTNNDGNLSDEELEELAKLIEAEAGTSDGQVEAEEESAEPAASNDPGVPEVPTPEEAPAAVVAPAAVDPTAVETTQSGLKFGWQQPAAKEYPGTMHCSHIGTVAARQQLRYQNIGDTWACTCGQIFEVVLNTGGKKILKEKKD